MIISTKKSNLDTNNFINFIIDFNKIIIFDLPEPQIIYFSLGEKA